MIHGLKIEKLMTRSPITIGTEERVSHAKALMERHGIRHLPVMKAQCMVGMVSDRDVKEAGFFRGPGDLYAEEIMSKDLVSAPPGALVSDVVYAMLLKKINAVPVLNEDGKLLGIFTSYDLFRLMLDHSIADERSFASEPIPFPEGRSLQWKRGKAREFNPGFVDPIA
jgi:acetoin utilization protein AcuB